MDISGKDPAKPEGTSYRQPFNPVPDKGPAGIGGPGLGQKVSGPNTVDWNRKANSDREQVVPQVTAVGSGDAVVTELLKSAQEIHEQGQESEPMPNNPGYEDTK